MKSVAELQARNLVGSDPNYQFQPLKTVEITPQAVAVMDKLFNQLTVICPAWHKALPSDESVANFKTVWLEEIINANIRNWKLLVRGLDRCKQSKNPFLPSIGQFIEWCLQEDYADLGLPDEATLLARVKAFQGYGMDNLDKFKFQSNAEYWLITTLYCRCKTSEWNDKQLADGVAKELVKMAKRIKQGESIPAPQITLPKATEPRLSQQEIANRWSALRSKLGARQ